MACENPGIFNMCPAAETPVVSASSLKSFFVEGLKLPSYILSVYSILFIEGIV